MFPILYRNIKDGRLYFANDKYYVPVNTTIQILAIECKDAKTVYMLARSSLDWTSKKFAIVKALETLPMDIVTEISGLSVDDIHSILCSKNNEGLPLHLKQQSILKTFNEIREPDKEDKQEVKS